MTILRLHSNRISIGVMTAIGAWLLAAGCSGTDQSPPPASGGGSSEATGGSSVNGGATGGTRTNAGGTNTGGKAAGGTNTGGKAAGGTNTGGKATGSTNAGGTSTGGMSSSGANTGGSSTCVPYHYAGTACSSCHQSNCTCETQYSSCIMGVCASPGTPIATPNGSRPIASLGVGDLVYSVHQGKVVAVPVERLRQAAVGKQHRVVRVELATGSIIEISAPHPTADGRRFGDLRPGDQLGGVRIVALQSIPYRYDFTHDILPASDSGTYFAGGVVVGSTLSSESNVPMCMSAFPGAFETLRDRHSPVARNDWWW